ncbi:VanZ family protein [Flavobacterium sp. UBA6135]|uniref:VanZ family protein n=1 Tax=Flavobacterium sp. UBA6135 TaxID=1946553 RepID=UPI0025C482F5|nr:VanZ family protein [Flavobacterium sp. UBA6135]
MDYKQKIFQVVFILWIIAITLLSLVETDKLPSFEVKNSDKFGHFVFYFLLTFFLFLALPKQRLSLRFKLLFSFSFSVIYGIIIEVLQGVVTAKRQPEILDVFANTLGSLLAVLVICFLLPRVKFLK